MINALTHLLRRTEAPFAVLRYDDLVADPRAAVARVIALTGEEAVPRLDADGITLGTDHTVSGNPMRFERGRVAIRADDEWRTAMRVADRAVVSALTWPGLRRYGFR